jgi:hypothetical protein
MSEFVSENKSRIDFNVFMSDLYKLKDIVEVNQV